MDEERTVLFASDFSPASQRALEQAAEIARALRARLFLLHVRSRWHSWISSGLLERHSKDRLLEWARHISARCADVKIEVTSYSDAGRGIAAIAARERATLIVVGAPRHKRRELKRCTVTRLLRWARQPVWISRPRGRLLPEQFACGVDGSEQSASALRFSLALSQELGASFCAVYAIKNPTFNALGMTRQEVEEATLRHKAEATSAASEFLSRQGVPINESIVQWGYPADVLVAVAEDRGMDVIAVGPSRAKKLQKVLAGTTATGVLFDAPCSVLAFPGAA